MQSPSIGRRALLAGMAAGVGAVAAGVLAFRGRRRPGPPNIVLVLTDDQGYNDLGCYWTPRPGQKLPPIRTPNLDALAADGLRFTDFYVAAPVCTPSRAAILTGCYPPRVGFSETTTVKPGDDFGLSTDYTSIARILKGAGYATACIGKWHLGHQPQFMPLRHGFDRFYGIPYSNNLRPLPLISQDEVVRLLPERPPLVEAFTREAVSFVAANRDRPFFLYLAHSAPHVPLSQADALPARPGGPRGLYGRVVEKVDDSVAVLIDAIRRHRLEEDTLVVFTSDNGPWLRMGNQGGDAFPFRGGKGMTLEGGMREPMIAWWPGTIAPGRVSDALTSALDFLPTFARLAGAEVRTPYALDGHDISPILLGTDERSPYEVFLYISRGRIEALRDARYKLLLGGTHRKKWSVSEALYDLREDPHEERDLKEQLPHVAAGLRERAEAERERLGLS